MRRWDRYRWKGERRAGYTWRLLAHRDEGDWIACGLCGWKGRDHGKHPKKCEGDWEHQRNSRSVNVYSTDYPEPICFDELVVDDWFHIEQMDDRHWWMRVGDLNIDVHVRSDGKRQVSGWWDTEDGNAPEGSGL